MTKANTPQELVAKLRALDDETMCFDEKATYALIADAADMIEARAAEIARLKEALEFEQNMVLPELAVRTAECVEAQDRATKAEARRDALLTALGFKAGDAHDSKAWGVILDDVAALRPAMREARCRANDAESAAILADCLVHDRGGLLLRVWKMLTAERGKRRKAEASLATMTAERDAALAKGAALREALLNPPPYACTAVAKEFADEAKRHESAGSWIVGHRAYADAVLTPLDDSSQAKEEPASNFNVTLHPSSIMLALDAEAESWATQTNLAATVNRMSANSQTREFVMRFAKQCFAEGAYQGACNAASGKLLFENMTKRPQGQVPEVV